MMDKRLIEIEKKISFQEHTIADLNKAIIDQQKQIRTLEAQIKHLKEQVTGPDLVKKQEDETPPPHY
ncbi:MAG TPA: SlyX family protein [Candidatus Omnitrophota bacterium]|nr:SlyX family protein [Candidatus Omnitrophota bacterium]